MRKAQVRSKIVTIKRHGRSDIQFRTWGFSISGWNGVVAQDDGFATAEDAFREAERASFAVNEIERRGHKLPSWRSLVDEARL